MRFFKLFVLFFRALFAYPRKLANGVYQVSDDVCRRKQAAKKGYGKGFPVADLLDVIPGLNESIRDYTYLDGTSRVTDIILLKSLAKSFNRCDYLEIGSFRGESLANISEAVSEAVSISLPDEEIIAMGDEDHVKLQRFFSKDLKNVKHIYHNSLTYDYSQLNKKFDLIFIDGDHSYRAIKKDTENAFKLLKDENSIIVWHDYGYSYNKENWTTISAIIEGAPADKREKIFHVSNTICAIFTNRPLVSGYVKLSDLPNKTFSMQVSASRIP
jgi:predicted O-methyltransferase YrrM